MIRHALFAIAVAVALVLFWSVVQAGPYVEGGFEIHAESWDRPEVTLENPIGHVEAGYQFRRQKWGTPSIYVRHLSGLEDREVGYGYSAVGAQIRLEFQE